MSDERARCEILAGYLDAASRDPDQANRAGMFAEAAAMLRTDGERIKALEEALVWCSGSPDFNDGGQAVEGWRKICAPLLEGKDHG